MVYEKSILRTNSSPLDNIGQVTGYHLLAEDAGTIACVVTIGGVNYTGAPLTLRVSGICL